MIHDDAEKDIRAKLMLSVNTKYPSNKRLVGLMWKDCPSDSLGRAHQSKDWLERAAVARHSRTSDPILDKLTSDIHPIVRALAKTNQNRRRP